MARYCSITELRGAIEKTNTDHESVLERNIEAASQAIDNFCNRPDGFLALTTATARTYSGSGKAIQRIDECVAVTLVEVKDSVTDTTYTAWAAGDWLAGRGDPRTAPDFNRTPYQWIMVDPTGDYDHFTSGKYAWRRGFRPDVVSPSRGVPTVRVTARWGHSATVPHVVKQACIIEVARAYKRGLSAYADTVANGDVGVLMYRKSLDPDVQHLLVEGRLVRPAIG